MIGFIELTYKPNQPLTIHSVSCPRPLNPKSLAQTCFIRIVYKDCNSSGVPLWCHLIEAVAPGRAQIPNRMNPKSQIERIPNRQTPSLCRFNPQSAFRNPKSNNSVFCLFSDFRIPTSEFQYLLLQIPHRHGSVTPFLSFADRIMIDIVKIKYARRRRYAIRL